MDSAIHKHHVLVVDDNADLLELMLHMLEHLGYTAKICSDENIAPVLYQEAKNNNCCFDVVILDLCMSCATSGLKVLEKLKKIDKNVRAICLSGNPGNIDLMDHGFYMVLQKPLTMAQLSNAMQNIPTYTCP